MRSASNVRACSSRHSSGGVHGIGEIHGGDAVRPAIPPRRWNAHDDRAGSRKRMSPSAAPGECSSRFRPRLRSVAGAGCGSIRALRGRDRPCPPWRGMSGELLFAASATASMVLPEGVRLRALDRGAPLPAMNDRVREVIAGTGRSARRAVINRSRVVL